MPQAAVPAWGWADDIHRSPEWQQEHQRQCASKLHQCFRVVTPDAAACLAAVETLDLHNGLLQPEVLALLLLHMPNLTAFTTHALPLKPLRTFPWLASLLCRGAPKIQRLTAPYFKVDLAAATLLSQLPHLQQLEVARLCTGRGDDADGDRDGGTDDDESDSDGEVDDAEAAAIWAVLQIEKLTHVHFSHGGSRLFPTTKALGLPRLVELRGVQLRGGAQAEALARGAPLLRLLCIHPQGIWDARATSRAAFARVTHAAFQDCKDGFCRGLRLRQLLPSVQHLVLKPAPFVVGAGESAWADLRGLDSLQTLTLQACRRMPPPAPREWAALAALPSLHCARSRALRRCFPTLTGCQS